MKLDDTGILEIHELCAALADDTITGVQSARLKEFLKSSEEAREIYFYSISLSNSLTEYANEMQSDEATLPIPSKVHPVRFNAWTVAILATAACVAIGLFVLQLSSRVAAPSGLEVADSDPQSGALVARITGTKDCVWSGAQELESGAAVQLGQHLELASGFAEVTFDSGARIMLEGPAFLDADSAWAATLRRGGLRATVPPQAIGFRLHHKSVEVVDLGTEFSMVADAGGDAEVRVLKGSVEVSPVSDEESGPVVMQESETRRFGKNRKGTRGDFEKRHTRLANAMNLERWNPLVNFAHWSFDDEKDGVFKGEAAGLDGMFNIKNTNATLTDGRWKRALHFDGSTALSVTVPLMPQSGSRTVAFWVRVPEDATLADAQAMLVWPLHSKKSGIVPLRVGWNCNPNQGQLGALRSEFDKIHVVGTTPLRDGNWHHIALAIVPNGNTRRVQVTQYVDGRLEGMTTRSVKADRVVLETNPSDVVWLGRMPGLRKKGERHFLGDMDELFIVDRALVPSEIISLMTQNTLPRNGLASF